jgi:hypothetical protein
MERRTEVRALHPTVTPEATGMIAAAVCSSNLSPGLRSTRSSTTPTTVITIAPARIERVS